MPSALTCAASVVAFTAGLLAQTGAPASPSVPLFAPGPAKFDVVSIKRSPSGATGSTWGLPPNGTATMTNVDISRVIQAAVPSEFREVVDLPDWTSRERFSINAKPPAGSVVAQRREMLWNMLVERMNISGHGELRERNGYELVVARADGRLGSALKPSDCLPPVPSPTRRECGTYAVRPGPGPGFTLVAVGIDMDRLGGVLELVGWRPGPERSAHVVNRTGLDGLYDFTFSSVPAGLTNAATLDSAAPADLFTAITEQLGLRLRAAKVMVLVFAIDRLERPTED